MNRNLMFAATVALAGVCALGAGTFQSWKGMLQAEPARLTLSPDARRLNLTGFREVSVLMEDLPDDLKDSLTREEIEAWTTNRLKNMNLRVVSDENQLVNWAAADRSTDEKTLAAKDRFMSMVYVNVNAMRLPSGAVCAKVQVNCDRGVFVHPGYFTRATIWSKANLGYYPSRYDVKSKIREALNELLDLLESDWKKCNR